MLDIIDPLDTILQIFGSLVLKEIIWNSFPPLLLCYDIDIRIFLLTSWLTNILFPRNGYWQILLSYLLALFNWGMKLFHWNLLKQVILDYDPWKVISLCFQMSIELPGFMNYDNLQNVWRERRNIWIVSWKICLEHYHMRCESSFKDWYLLSFFLSLWIVYF